MALKKTENNVTIPAKQPGFISCFFKTGLPRFNAVLFPGAVEGGCRRPRKSLKGAGPRGLGAAHPRPLAAPEPRPGPAPPGTPLPSTVAQNLCPGFRPGRKNNRLSAFAVLVTTAGTFCAPYLFSQINKSLKNRGAGGGRKKKIRRK